MLVFRFGINFTLATGEFFQNLQIQTKYYYIILLWNGGGGIVIEWFAKLTIDLSFLKPSGF